MQVGKVTDPVWLFSGAVVVLYNWKVEHIDVCIDVK